MKSPSRKMTRFIVILMGILLSATLLSAQTPSRSRYKRPRVHGTSWVEFIPNWFSRQFRRFNKRHYDNRNNEHRRFSYRGKSWRDTRGDHHDRGNDRGNHRGHDQGDYGDHEDHGDHGRW